jgi:peptidyl-prolyl cis-trans isomerase SurA
MLAAAALAGLAASGVQGQEAPAAADAFNIPDDIQMLGTADPNNRRATARVNGNIITGTDVEHRVALVLDANQQQVTPEELQRLRLQVLRNLIDETLQVQEAAALEMEVTTEEVDQAYERLATSRFDRTPEELDEYLRSIGSSPQSLKRQIQGELAWNRLLQRNVAPFVNVSSNEVTELFERLQSSRGTAEYRIGEIYLSATPANREEVERNARRIVEQLRQGGSFVAYARQFSEASTAAVGGDLGWIRLEQLQNPQLEEAAQNLQPGQLVGPLEIPGGFSILLLIDKRSIGMADPRDAVLSLKQISLDFPDGIAEADAQERANAFAAAVQSMNGCGDADAKAAAIGAQTVDNDEIAVRALPEALQAPILELSVGQSTPIFGALDEGVRVLMLCGRDDPQTEQGPNFEQLMAQIEDDRVNKRAQRYLRDLRRDAVIEYN